MKRLEALPTWISIHALHEESDHRVRVRRGDRRQISIHALHEESDIPYRLVVLGVRISIHALHEESDSLETLLSNIKSFQSTLSMRRATLREEVAGFRLDNISIHALHEESDGNDGQLVAGHGFISIHALHEESDA